MRKRILALLRSKSVKETVDMTTFLKALVGRQDWPKIHELKHELDRMVHAGELIVINNEHLRLNTINTTNYISEDGNAVRTRYHNLDSVTIGAYGLSDSEPAPEPVKERKPIITEKITEDARKRFFGDSVLETKPEVKPEAPILPIEPEKPAAKEAPLAVTGNGILHSEIIDDPSETTEVE